MRHTLLPLILVAMLSATAARAGENPPLIPPAELQALDRAISRELNSGQMGSQTLGDLYRLKNRLLAMQKSSQSESQRALEPLDGDDSQRRQLERLEREAESGGRAARRSLALYYLFLSEPEKALAQWRLMGKGTDNDVNYLLISSYLEFALGEYNSGRRDLETALRFIDTRSSLVVSTPVFCQTVGAYRVYTPRPAGNLLPGEDVLLYVEVDGAEFARSPDGGTECRIMFGMKLKNDNQSTVWAEPNYGEYAPAFSGPIRDLHAALSWRVPNDLEPGRYHLTVEAMEESTRRRGESVVGFNVAKRETNPEKRPTGGPAPTPRTPQELQMQQMQQRAIEDAQRTFYGGGAAPGGGMEPPVQRSPEYYQQYFDLLQQHERGRKVE